ncbi:MAG: hypothetical protein BGO49_07190 [Planctomycetales bacterium 71-10]|nr:MAG: hypothetical protein BGO49_07190 [Planctomycetales bacterium 71-10]
MATATSKYMSKQEIVEALGVDESTVRRWVKSGRLPRPAKPGGARNARAYFPREAVERLMQPHGGGDGDDRRTA